jgi:hypothetical protein
MILQFRRISESALPDLVDEDLEEGYDGQDQSLMTVSATDVQLDGTLFLRVKRKLRRCPAPRADDRHFDADILSGWLHC